MEDYLQQSGQLMANIVSPGGPSMVGFNFSGPMDHLRCDKIYNSSEISSKNFFADAVPKIEIFLVSYIHSPFSLPSN